MIKIKTIKGVITADAVGTSELVSKEVLATTVYLTRLFARATNMSFDSAALYLMQHSAIVNKRAMEDLNKGEET